MKAGCGCGEIGGKREELIEEEEEVGNCEVVDVILS